MDTRIRKVETEDELHEKVDDYQFQGYSIVERSERQVKLRNTSIGTGGMHFLWFILTFWFTMGLGNLGYGLYAYHNNSTEVIVKIKK